jgi:hypothetical protein
MSSACAHVRARHAMFEMTHFPYRADFVQLSAHILDIELVSNVGILDVNTRIEPSNLGHPRAGCSRMFDDPASGRCMDDRC